MLFSEMYYCGVNHMLVSVCYILEIYMSSHRQKNPGHEEIHLGLKLIG
jgi:hypothetical protein